MTKQKNSQISQKPLLKVLKGEKIFPPPIWLMRQAGRFLPEFREIREKADFLTRCTTPDLTVELTLQPIRRFHMDGAILFSDILILPWALGQKLEFIPRKGPHLEQITSLDDLQRIDHEISYKITHPIMEAIKRLSKILAVSSTTLLGFAGAPFTVACYMVEGGGSKFFPKVSEAIYQNSLFFDKLMDFLTEKTISWLKMQIESGVQAVMLFDSWASLLPPILFERYVISSTRKIVQNLKKDHPQIPIIGFPRLCGLLIADYVQKTNIDVVSLDITVDLKFADKILPPSTIIQGNLDPFSVLYGGSLMERQIKDICYNVGNRPHIFNLGHGVMPQTPLENVAQLIEIIRSLRS